MIRGIYTSATGMEMQRYRNQVLADNMANASTTGYKSYDYIYKSFETAGIRNSLTGELIGEISHGAEIYDTNINFRQGAFRQTGNPLDLAIQGEGFFAVQDLDGNTMYTRDGSFTLDDNGFIVNHKGEYLLDSGFAPIFVGQTGVQTVTILRNGNLMVNGNYNTQLRAFKFREGSPVIRVDGTGFEAAGADKSMVIARQATFQQGFLEQSNVSAVKAAADMVNTARSYESSQRALRAQIETLDMLMDVGDL